MNVLIKLGVADISVYFTELFFFLQTSHFEITDLCYKKGLKAAEPAWFCSVGGEQRTQGEPNLDFFFKSFH